MKDFDYLMAALLAATAAWLALMGWIAYEGLR